VALITPILLDASAFGAYFLFGGLTLGTLIVLAAYMPETKGEPLENIQEVFSKPLRVHGVDRLRQRKSAMTVVETDAASMDSGVTSPGSLPASITGARSMVELHDILQDPRQSSQSSAA
jgi:hypothetical protein